MLFAMCAIKIISLYYFWVFSLRGQDLAFNCRVSEIH